jgi:alpha-beta hydrolase superfamily lysophospholipase
VPAPTRTDRPASRGNQAVQRWDNDAARHVVVLAHGIGEHVRRYDHVADALVDAGAVVYAPDHYGHGESDGEQGLADDIEVMVTDLVAVARDAVEAHPGLPLVLVGHSMGGLIAVRTAQRGELPLDALVLSGPFLGNPGFEPLLTMDPMPDVPVDPSLLSRDERVGEAYAADPLVYHGSLRQESLRGLFAGVAEVEAGPRLSMPTLWLHGAEDGLAPAEVSRAQLERIRPEVFEEHVYPGAKHEIFNETNRLEVIGDLVDFVDRTVHARAGA